MSLGLDCRYDYEVRSRISVAAPRRWDLRENCCASSLDAKSMKHLDDALELASAVPGMGPL